MIDCALCAFSACQPIRSGLAGPLVALAPPARQLCVLGGGMHSQRHTVGALCLLGACLHAMRCICACAWSTQAELSAAVIPACGTGTCTPAIGDPALSWGLKVLFDPCRARRHMCVRRLPRRRTSPAALLSWVVEVGVCSVWLCRA